MNAYTDIDYYNNSYFGSLITSANFNKYESKAKDILDYLTQNRIDENMFEKYSDKIKKSECAIMDILFNVEKAQSMTGITESGEGKIVKSRTSGSESVSYDTSNDIYLKAAADYKLQNNLFMNAIRIYLYDTGLLYRGC